MRIAIYSRKSKFTGKGESIENQIELCRNYITEHIPNSAQAEILIYEDEGFSGKNLQRPKFQEMMAISKQKHFDYIVCYRLDRISRSVSDFSSLIEDLNIQKTAFICIKEQFDTSNPMGKAMMYIASVFAQLERETIAERIRDNMAMLAKTGRWLGGTTPTGFRSEQEKVIAVDNKVRTSCKLVPVSKELELVRFIYDKFLERQTIGGVTTFLVQNDIKTRQGKDFTNLAVKEILLNPVYCIADSDAYEYFVAHDALVCFNREECDGQHAFLAYNRTDKTKSYQSKKPISEWTVAIGKHKGIIPGHVWVKIQKLLEEKKLKSTIGTRIPHFSNALLSGLLVCGECGHFMRPHIHSHRAREDGSLPFYYICEYKERSARAKCQMKNLDGRVVEKIVCDELLRYDQPNSSTYKSLQALRKKVEQYKTTDQDRQSFLTQQIEEKQSMMKNLVLALAKNDSDDFSASIIREQINELNEQREKLQAELSNTTFNNEAYDDCKKQIEMVISALRSLGDISESTDVVDKREILRAIIDKIIWDGENIHIFLLGE